MDKHLKLIAYAAIVVFAVIFTALIGLFVVKPLIEQCSKEAIELIEQAKEFKELGDSIETAVKEDVELIIKDKLSDSIKYVREKESLRVNYLKNVKKYESKILAVDTISDSVLNGQFSVRDMLCDSAAKVW
jgi:hypothetical protein